MIFVLLPGRIEIKAICSDFISGGVVEFQHIEVGTTEWMECSVRLLELVDMARSVSKVERPSEVELDMVM